MELKTNDIESIKVVGELNGQDVKIVRTHGGFNMAVGLKKKGKKDPEVLAAGSHPALVSHQLTKEYNDNFKPKLCKSEDEQLPIVEEVTSKLEENTSNQGFEAFVLEKNDRLDFIISRFGLDILVYETEKTSDQLVFKNHKTTSIAKNNINLSKELAKIIDDKCKELNISKIQVNK